MNILFEINHPAHFHLFKNPVNSLISQGHNITILAKSNSPLPQLLSSKKGWDVIYEGKKGRRIISKIVKQFAFTFLAIRIILTRRINLCVGVSITMPQAAFLTGRKSLVLDDDDRKATPIFAALSHTFATRVLSPDCLRTKEKKSKFIYYPGFHELSYLHPSVFSPEKNILSLINPAKNEYIIILRFVDFNAHHDIGEKGMNSDQKKKLISVLSKKGRIIITSESKLSPELEDFSFSAKPEKIHDLMAFANLYVGESQTMAAEAALLGIPSVRINTFKNRISYLAELESKYGLLYSYTPHEFEEAIQKITKLLKPGTKDLWIKKRNKMLSDKINVSDFITSQILEFSRN